jgi:hypothetical protein
LDRSKTKVTVLDRSGPVLDRSRTVNNLLCDGLTPQQLAKDFKQRFLDRLFFALVDGNAGIALAVGY